MPDSQNNEGDNGKSDVVGNITKVADAKLTTILFRRSAQAAGEPESATVGTILKRYRLRPIQESEVMIQYRHNEAEEELIGDLTEVGSYLIGFVSEPMMTHSHKIKTWNLQRRMSIEARVRDPLYSAADWRSSSEEHIKSNLEKSERARIALFNDAPIPQVATRVNLRVKSVRRLAGRLRRRTPCKSKYMEPRLNWTLTQVIEGWNLSSLLNKHPLNRNKKASPTELVATCGTDRIKALMTYCGLSRDDVHDALSRELPRLIQFYAPKKATELRRRSGPFKGKKWRDYRPDALGDDEIARHQGA